MQACELAGGGLELVPKGFAGDVGVEFAVDVFLPRSLLRGQRVIVPRNLGRAVTARVGG